MDPLTILPALIPALTDGVRGLIRGFAARFGKGKLAQPQNIDEVIKLGQADVERLKALAALDQPNGNVSQWVADLRASARYIAVGLVFVCAGGATLFASSEIAIANAQQLMGSAFFFLFGDRVYLHIRGK